MAAHPAYLKNWQAGLGAETVETLQRQHSVAAPAAETASQQIAEILRSLGFTKLLSRRLPASRYSLDGYTVYRSLLQTPLSQLPQLADYAKIYSRFALKEEDRYTYTNDFLNICSFYNRLRDSKLKISPEQFFQTNAMLFQEITAPADDYYAKSKVLRGIYNHQNASPLRDAFCLRFMSAAVSDGITDSKVLYALLDGFDNYTRDPGRLNSDFMKGLLRNVIPQAKINPVFSQKENMWGMYPFEYGIGDFNYRAKTSRVTPALINEMMLVSQEFATVNFRIFETNRRDGLTLADTFGALRDCIHDQRYGTSTLIAAMVDYYDAAAADKAAAADRLRTAAKEQDYNLNSDCLLDLANYDRLLPRHGDAKHQETAISVLRRLRINTVPETDRAPLTNIDKVNQLSAELGGEFPDRRKLGDYLGAINDCLEDAVVSRRIGIEPSLLSHLNWASRLTARVLANQDYESQAGDFRTPYFKQVLRFAELTHNPSTAYNPAEFEAYYQRVAAAPCMEIAYAEVCRRQNHNLQGLAKRYRRIAAYNRKVIASLYPPGDGRRKAYRLIRAQKDRRINQIVSGSLLKELQNLTQYKPASCEIGRRHQEEQRRTLSERLSLFNLEKQLDAKGIDLSTFPRRIKSASGR